MNLHAEIQQCREQLQAALTRLDAIEAALAVDAGVDVLQGWCQSRIRLVCAAHGVTAAQVLGRARTKAVNDARCFVYLALRADGLSWPAIGRIFGRDHSTCVKGAARAEKMLGEVHP